ncbi:RNA-directed DNA polymerase from mobile element jockey-like [Brachionus plicatilis]|uniref:RNA-directed DNA polymerase from mobile element jockey-like n=1 Tax=Brachionus plicatilis TaxID=10195 RepID=A0A3M7RVZ8_BRAPC|nr:RNA-directed DNA polymerase from mobile element jockey-like [Brachionus plicatilis]
MVAPCRPTYYFVERIPHNKRSTPRKLLITNTLFTFFSDISEMIPKNVKVLFTDDLCIWFTNQSLKMIEITLNHAIECIKKYCNVWGLRININKTFQTVFTTAGYRINYHSKYKLNLFLDQHPIPLEPFPTFLGIEFDPKLSFKNLFENILLFTLSKPGDEFKLEPLAVLVCSVHRVLLVSFLF